MDKTDLSLIKKSCSYISTRPIENISFKLKVGDFFAACEHPKVAEVAVVGYADEKLGEKICAVAVPAKDQMVTLEDILQFLREKDIAIYKMPEKLLVVESLPRNPVGKVLKRELKNLAV